MATQKKTVKKKEVKTYGLVTGTDIPRTRTKVAIVGFAPSSMEHVRALFDNPEWEIWGLNQLYMAFPMMAEQATRWFQLHHRHSYDINVGRAVGHHEWMSQQRNFPIYMQKQEPDVPMSVPFPKDEFVSLYGNYFTNSISWMIMTAVYEMTKYPSGNDEISIFGVDMAQDGEYRHERPSCEWAIGWARGAGIKVNIPEASDLFKTLWLYPFEDSAPFRAKIEARRIELRSRHDQLANQEQLLHDQRMQLLGALDNQNYVLQSWESSIRETATTLPK
jgi:hypothetical protein